MQIQKKPEIFIHVGMSRTASTFFQHQVFPEIKGLYFRRKIKFKDAVELLQAGLYEKYLVSDELDNRDVESVLSGFAARFPEARPIVLIRRQDEWVVSQFKRYLKNGLHWRFTEFLDMEHDTGFIKKDHLHFSKFIAFLEARFDNKPLVLLYDDFRKYPDKCIQRIVDFMGATILMNEINMSPRHTSYKDRQLLAIYWASGIFNLTMEKKFRIKGMNKLLFLWRDILRYGVLYGSDFLPDKSREKKDVLPTAEQIESIRNYCSEDWERCVAFAERIEP